MKKNSSAILLALGLGAAYLLTRSKAEGTPTPTPTPTLPDMVVGISHSPLSGVAPVTVNFEASWTNATVPFVSIHWNFGDGDSSQFLNPSHTYRSAGNYVVKVSLQDSAGRTDDASTNVTVFAPPFVAPAPSAGQVYVTPSIEEIPAIAWQPAPEYSEGQVAYTTDKPADVQVGGTASDGAPLTYYYLDGKLIAVRAS